MIRARSFQKRLPYKNWNHPTSTVDDYEHKVLREIVRRENAMARESRVDTVNMLCFVFCVSVNNEISVNIVSDRNVSWSNSGDNGGDSSDHLPPTISGSRGSARPEISLYRRLLVADVDQRVNRTIGFDAVPKRNHRMTQQRQYRCRDAPALGGGVTGAKYACTLIFGRCVCKEIMFNP